VVVTAGGAGTDEPSSEVVVDDVVVVEPPEWSSDPDVEEVSPEPAEPPSFDVEPSLPPADWRSVVSVVSEPPPSLPLVPLVPLVSRPSVEPLTPEPLSVPDPPVTAAV
jgi:hypothetical protein